MPSPHSAHLRRGRVSEPGRVYLLTTVTLNRQPVFAEFALARLAIGALRDCDLMGLCDTLAYVLMPNHLHWLIDLRHTDLSALAARAKAGSARAVNRARGQSGRLWQAGFHDHAARRDEDIQALARYVVANPLRAGLVRHLGDYPHWDAVWL
jgi:putative transposase